MSGQEDEKSGFQILNPETDFEVPGEKTESEKKPSAGAKATREREEALPYKSHTEMPLREQVAIVGAFLVLVYLLVLVFESSASHRYDPNTSRRPGMGESIVPNRGSGSGPSKAPW